MPKKSTTRRKIAAKAILADHRVILARRLDLLADLELQHGHHLAAERLAWRAAEMREGVR